MQFCISFDTLWKIPVYIASEGIVWNIVYKFNTSTTVI